MIRFDVYRVSMPMQRPFSHSLSMRSTATSIFVVIDDGEIRGIGECAPRPYVTGEDIDTVLLSLVDLDIEPLWNQIDLANFSSAVQSIETIDLAHNLIDGQFMPAAACAVELALLDLIGQRFEVSLHSVGQALTGQPLPALAPTKALPISTVVDFSASIDDTLMEPNHLYHIKLKVGADTRKDVERLRRIRDLVGVEVQLSVDANCAWTYDDALRAVEAFQPYNVAWYEEPLAPRSYRQMAALRRVTGTRLMLDESLCSLVDAKHAIAEQAADLFNLRVSKVGGLINAFNLYALSREHGIGCQVGVQVGEMGPLWAAGRKLAMGMERVSAYEAGQADRFFKQQMIAPAPVVDRKTYLGRPLLGNGLGVVLNNVFYEHAELVASNSPERPRFPAAVH